MTRREADAARHWGIYWETEHGRAWYAGDALGGLGLRWSDNPRDAIDYGTRDAARLVLREAFPTHVRAKVGRIG